MTSWKKHKEIWFLFQDNALVIEKHASNTQLTWESIQILKPYLIHQHTLTYSETELIVSAELENDYPLPEHLTAIPLRTALEMLDQNYTQLSKAYGIINWDKNHRYCGRCGGITERKENALERLCPVCELTFYPRISPSVIVRIHRGDEILMARSPHFRKGAYGLIAGFVETGESLEEAVHREVKEEVNIKIKNLAYFGSQAWPFPDSLMVAFTAEYDSGELILDQNEIEEAGWYRYDQLPGKPSSRITIASKLIDAFITDQLKGRNPHGS